MPSTSGTVSTTTFTLRNVIDHAARRAQRAPQRLSAEDLVVAKELVYTLTSEWINAQFPLWTREFLLLAVTQGSMDVSTPTGTVEVIHSYWRILNPWRGAATLTTGGDGSNLFAGGAVSDTTITGPNPGVIVPFGSDTEVDTVGILPGGSATNTSALEIATSDDGVTFTTVQTMPSASYAPGTWVYFDLKPFIVAPYVRLRLPIAGSWVLNQCNLGLANGQNIPLGPLNMDDYWNQPNQQFSSGQPNSAFVDRQVNTPVIKVWPTPDSQAFYSGTVTALVRRYIQDPGALTDNVEVPQRWNEALIWRLAHKLLWELPAEPGKEAEWSQLKLAFEQRLDQKAQQAEALVWAEERDRSPIRVLPSLRAYTR